MGSNPQPPDHESDALTTVPRCPSTDMERSKVDQAQSQTISLFLGEISRAYVGINKYDDLIIVFVSFFFLFQMHVLQILL